MTSAITRSNALMNTTLTRRNAVRLGLGTVAAGVLAGCANQNGGGSPTTQPTTQPSAEQQAFDTASGVLTFVNTLALTALPFIPPPYNAEVTTALGIASAVMETWHANLGKGMAAEFEAQFAAQFPAIMQLIAQGKAKAAGTTPEAAKAKAARLIHR